MSLACLFERIVSIARGVRRLIALFLPCLFPASARSSRWSPSSTRMETRCLSAPSSERLFKKRCVPDASRPFVLYRPCSTLQVVDDDDDEKPDAVPVSPPTPSSPSSTSSGVFWLGLLVLVAAGAGGYVFWTRFGGRERFAEWQQERAYGRM